METPVLGILQWDSCVLWGWRLDFYFVEKCSLSLYWPSIAQQEREYLPTIFAPYMPPYGAGRDSVSLPSLDSHHGRD